MVRRLVLLLLASCRAAALAPPSKVVVFGPGSPEMRLITAKLAAKAGFQTSLVTGAGSEKQWRRLMYGSEYADGGSDDADRVQIAVDNIPEAIGAATGLCVICDSASLPDGAMTSALDAAVDIERVVLLSQMGVTRATGGFLGKSDIKLLEGEQRIREACAKRGIEPSVVRVGTLKGGGPGRYENNVVVSGVELGLAPEFYATIFDLETALVTQSYDKFTLGAACAAGDPSDLANPLLRLAYKGSFDPREDETSRVVAGGAMIAALSHPTALEFTVSAAKGEAPPTSGQWEALLNAL